jgi:hypothetical protein
MLNHSVVVGEWFAFFFHPPGQTIQAPETFDLFRISQASRLQ